MLYTPPSSTLYAYTGTVIDPTIFTFTADASDTPDAYVDNFAITDSNHVALSNGATVFPGVTLYAPAGNPVGIDTSLVLQGTPTLNGTYTIYATVNWTNPGAPSGQRIKLAYRTWTVNVSGGTALSVTPAAPNVPGPVGTVGGNYASGQFTISTGGPFRITLSGGPSTIGLSTDPTSPSTSQTLTTVGNAFYLTGTPTSVFSGPITISVHDQTANLDWAGTYSFSIVSAGGGTLSITEGTPQGYPNGQTTCFQTQLYSVTYTVTGGVGPYSWGISGSLPAGLNARALPSNINGIITGTPLVFGSFTYSVTVTDSASNSASLPKTLTISPFANLTGTLPVSTSDGTINTTYGSNVLTAIGGDPTLNYGWKVQVVNPDSSTSPYIFAGLTVTPSVSDAGVVGAFHVYSGATLTFSGQPTSAIPAGSKIRVIPAAEYPPGLSVVLGAPVDFPITVTGLNALSFNISTLPAWVQNTTNTQTIDVVGSTGTCVWTVTGLPSGITPSFGGGTSGTISGACVTAGSYNVVVSVHDSSSPTVKNGSISYTLVVTPDIWFTPTSLPTVSRGSSLTPTAITFHGGLGTGFSYANATLPAGVTYTTSGANSETLNFSGTVTQGSGTFTTLITVTVDTSGGRIPKIISLPLVITGTGSGTIVPYATTLCVYDSLLLINRPKVAIGAVLSGFTGSNANNYSITPPSGWTPVSGPVYSSPNGGGTFTQDTHINGPYTFTIVSLADGTVTASVMVTVNTGVSTNPSLTPATANLYAGQDCSLTAIMPNSCSGNSGYYNIVSSITHGAILNINRSSDGHAIVTAPTPITTPATIVVSYNSNEDPDRVVYAYINLLPGVPCTGTFSILTSSLPNGAVGVPYNAPAITTYGGTGTKLFSQNTDYAGYSTPGCNAPAPIVLSAGGILSSSTNLLYPSTNKVAIYAKDSASPSLWTGTVFDLTITTTDITAPTITSIAPSREPATGPFSLAVVGTNFQVGDVVTFVSQSISFSQDAVTTTFVSSTGLTAVTPNWVGPPGLVAVAITRGGNFVVLKNDGFTFGSAGVGLAVTSFSPSSATVNDGDKVIDVVGTGFDGSCSIIYTRSDGGGDQTLSTQSLISGTDLRGTILAANFSPTHSGTTATIKVTKGDGSSAVCTAMVFNVNPVALTITTTSLPDATRSAGYSQTLTALGGTTPYVWSITGSLPTGLTMDSSGNITGTTDGAAVTATPTFVVTDHNGLIATSAITIHVGGGGLTITTLSPLHDATIGTSYTQAILASGGVSPLTFTRVSGSFPTGLNLSNDGILSGTPTSGNAAPSTFSFTIQCVDSTTPTPQTTSLAYSLHLSQALSTITITSISPTYGTLSGGTQVTLTGTGFANGCTAQFGVTSATVQFGSSTSITAITPPASAAGVVSISVQNPDGGQGLFTTPGFDYQVLTSPVITGLDNQDGPFAGGQTVVLSGNNFQGISAISFGVTSSNAVQASFNPTTDLSLNISPQTATIQTPPGTTFGDGSTAVGVNIYVTNTLGTGVWPIGDNGYMYRPPPIITAIVPNTGPTSGGQTVYVVGSNFFQRGAAKPRIFIGNVEVPASSVTLIEN